MIRYPRKTSVYFGPRLVSVDVSSVSVITEHFNAAPQEMHFKFEQRSQMNAALAERGTSNHRLDVLVEMYDGSTFSFYGVAKAARQRGNYIVMRDVVKAP